jgi:hypothetical protein
MTATIATERAIDQTSDKTAIQSWADQAFPKLIHFNKLNKGGHFAAWEQPRLFSEEVRVGSRSLR